MRSPDCQSHALVATITVGDVEVDVVGATAFNHEAPECGDTCTTTWVLGPERRTRRFHRGLFSPICLSVEVIRHSSRALLMRANSISELGSSGLVVMPYTCLLYTSRCV